jgi:hypothetical protein
MARNLFATAVCVILATGCAAPFNYVMPAPNLIDAGPTCVVIQPVIVSPDKETAKLFDADLDQTLFDILESELAASSRFGQTIRAISLSELDSRLHGMRDREVIVLQPRINSIRWFVANYEEHEKAVFRASLFGGVIGGIMYGSTKVDMEGITEVSINYSHPRSGRVAQRTYTQKAVENMTLLDTDSHDRRRKLIEASVRSVMNDIRSDLKAVLEELVK